MIERGVPRDNGATGGRPVRLSYKFQRLREAIREAIVNGSLPDRLPGERELGRRFGANAKTINKALSDLTAEGLLVRRIGRGTYRAGTSAAQSSPAQRLAYAFTGASAATQALAIALNRCAAASGWSLEMLSTGSRPGGDQAALADWPASARKDTGALMLVCEDALSRNGGGASAALLMEAQRRHVPVVSVGTTGSHTKLNSVVPDFSDAGYRSAEHLYRLGCESVLVFHTAMHRDVESALNGCRTAATRFGGRCTITCLSSVSLVDSAEQIAGVWSEEKRRGTRSDNGAAVGVVLVGAAARNAAWQHGGLAALWSAGKAAVVCIRDLGEGSVDEASLTTYEFDAVTAARRAVELCDDVRTGQRPVEIIVPGRLAIRETIAPASSRGDSTRPESPASSHVMRSASAEVSI